MVKQVGPELALAGLFATITFFAGCFLLRITELGMIIQLARDTLKQRRAKGSNKKTGPDDATGTDENAEPKPDEPSDEAPSA